MSTSAVLELSYFLSIHPQDAFSAPSLSSIAQNSSNPSSTQISKTMEATVVSVAKSVLDGALGKAKSAVADEVALQLGVQRDLAFIKDEFEMMQTFLMAADEDRAKKKVVETWVKQVRDLAYDVEDCLQDFGVHLQKPSRWSFPRTLRARHRIAKEIKELKARVEDVSQRNLRYRLIEDSNPTTATERSSITSADEPRIAAGNKDEPKVDLCQLITADDQALRVISVCGGASDDLKKMSIIMNVYDSQEIYTKFGCRAWVKLMNPVNPNDLFQSLVRQFYLNSLRAKGKAEEGAAIEAGVLKKMETVTAPDHLFDEFHRYVNENRYLIVIDDLSTVVEWYWIKIFFPDRKNGSRIVASTEQAEIARLCTGQPNPVSNLNQLPTDQPLYLFYSKPESSIQPVATDHSTGMGGTSLAKGSSSATGKSLARNRSMMQAALEDPELVGREAERSAVIKLILQEHCQVISLLGMGGIGKTTLVRSVYGSEELGGMFQKRVWVTVLHPFNPEEFFRSLALRLHTDISDDDNTEKSIRPMGDDIQKKSQVMQIEALRKRLQGMQIADLRKETSQLLGRDTYLIVLDDLSSNTEWDSIIPHLPKSEKASRIIITTRDKSVASRCSDSKRYKLESLGDDAALDLFKKKVFSETEKVDLTDDMMDQAKLILKKCDGLPLAIATIGSFLATKPKTTLEWRKLNDHISVELANNPELDKIKTVLTSSYDGLPYHLKSCFLYLSIFPEGRNIRYGRLVRRWIAEGYSREVRSKTAEEVAEEHFTDIINRSMIQPSKTGTDNAPKTTDFFQVHDLMREISISKSEEENLVFVLDEHSTLQSKNKVRHLVVSRSWSRDQKKDVLGSILDVSHIRSLTVFGEWRSFFISKRMRLLRVLDLEDVVDLQDHDLVPIGDLRYLKYLSLRCVNRLVVYIYHLPDSFGNLSDLETLDIRGTFVVTLPASIVKLSKLKYLRAGLVPFTESHSWEFTKIDQPLKEFGLAAYKSYLQQKKSVDDSDALPYLCFKAGVWLRGWDMYGVKVPRGIGRLKALHTLGVVNIARGKAMLKELKKLSQLRKLGVTGINKKNCKELCSAIANHGRLRSLSMRAEGEAGLEGCLDDLPPPPNDLQSLKLCGYLVKLPTWIQQIQTLAKLTLRNTQLEHDAIVVLGELPNLAILRLCYGSLEEGELRFHFHPDTFTSLTELELDRLNRVKSVAFEEKATPKLELLRVHYCLYSLGDGFSGIPFLSSLKEVSLKFPHYRYFDVCHFDEKMENLLVDERMQKIMEGRRNIREGLRDQLTENKNKPHLKIED